MRELGTIIGGKYKLLHLLGAGGLGQVYSAEHLPIGREVAIKLLHREIAANAQIAERFEREARAAARVVHPNSVVLFDFGRDGDLLYLVMERLRGETLYARLDMYGRLAPEEGIPFLLQLCDALSACHEAGLVHRDLKPENVMIARMGGRDIVKLLDYGIAKIVDGSSITNTKTGHLLGTPPYMSPELISNERHLVGPATDLYAVGIILFEVLTGLQPFTGDSHIDIFRQHLMAVPPSLESCCAAPGLHHFETVMQRALAKAPAARYGSAEELRCALAGALMRYLDEVDDEVDDESDWSGRDAVTVVNASLTQRAEESAPPETLLLTESAETVRMELASINAYVEAAQARGREAREALTDRLTHLSPPEETETPIQPPPTLLLRCKLFVRSLFSRLAPKGASTGR